MSGYGVWISKMSTLHGAGGIAQQRSAGNDSRWIPGDLYYRLFSNEDYVCSSFTVIWSKSNPMRSRYAPGRGGNTRPCSETTLSADARTRPVPRTGCRLEAPCRTANPSRAVDGAEASRRERKNLLHFAKQRILCPHAAARQHELPGIVRSVSNSFQMRIFVVPESGRTPTYRRIHRCLVCHRIPRLAFEEFPCSPQHKHRPVYIQYPNCYGARTAN
jgi:hypothetical protein